MLSIVVCAAPPAAHIGTLAQRALDDGWDVLVVATPSALAFLDRPGLERRTGHPVHSEYRRPDEPPHRGLPEPAAVIVAPATFNSINKLAAGITDTYALGHVSDAIGRRVPVVIVPFVNAALGARRPYRQALESLRSEGVTILPNDHRSEPTPGTGETPPLPWAEALAALARRQP